MPHDECAAAIAELNQALSAARIKVGAPGYEEIQAVSEAMFGKSGRLASSTTHEILNGKSRSTPAKWDWIGKYWKVMRAIATRKDLDPDSIGSLDAWKKLHEAAWGVPRQSHELAAATGSGAGARTPSGLITGYVPEPGGVPGQPTRMVPVGESCPDAERLMSIRRAIGVEWWDDYSTVVPDFAGTYLSLEPAAKLIHCYETAVVPSLLQTEAYAAAIIRPFDETLPDEAIGRMVELRMRRQQILTEPNAPRVWAVFNENALRRELGDASIITAQIRHLIEISRLPNVTIQVIPAVTRIRAALGYPITLLSFHVHDSPDVVYLEQLTSAVYLHDPHHVGRYSKLLIGLTDEALSRAETPDYLRRMLWETG